MSNSQFDRTLDIRQGRDPAALRPMPKRDGLDNTWLTPSCLSTALIKKVLPHLNPDLPIWECAAGDGRILDALCAAGRKVIATDIAPQRDDIGRLDFLTETMPESAIGGALITNPPFARSGLGDRFFARALKLLDRKKLVVVIFLQRDGAASTDGRAEIFGRAACEFRCCWRPRWIPGSTEGPRWAFSWSVWHADSAGPPVIHFLRKRDLGDVR